MRFTFVLLHRYAGLLIAAFLFVSGLTGAVISWDHELDGLLNPQLVEARSEGVPIAPFEAARRVEERDPRVRVTFVPLAAEPGKSLLLGVDPRVDPVTGRLYQPGYNEVFLDPVTGEELGRREWGGVWPVSRENFVSFLYVLHYSLHIPEMWGIHDWGPWLLGGVAIIWTLDCFVGFYLSLPARRREAGESGNGDPASRTWWQRWRPAWRVRWSGGSTKVNFDLHRAGSLWTWGLLFILAFTGFSLNLYSEVFYPMLSKVSQVTPSPFDLRAPSDPDEPIAPRIGYERVLELARADAQRRGWKDPVGSVYYAQNYGFFGVAFHEPGADTGTGGVDPPMLFVDGLDGNVIGEQRPWEGTAADLFVQAQFPLHSGRILGMPGRILVSLMGLLVAMLSVTGVVIWARKRHARKLRASLGAPLRSGNLVVRGSP